jgi:hypothetical protein
MLEGECLKALYVATPPNISVLTGQGCRFSRAKSDLLSEDGSGRRRTPIVRQITTLKGAIMNVKTRVKVGKLAANHNATVR